MEYREIKINSPFYCGMNRVDAFIKIRHVNGFSRNIYTVDMNTGIVVQLSHEQKMDCNLFGGRMAIIDI